MIRLKEKKGKYSKNKEITESLPSEETFIEEELLIGLKANPDYFGRAYSAYLYFLWYIHYNVRSLYATIHLWKSISPAPARRAVFTRFFVKKSFLLIITITTTTVLLDIGGNGSNNALIQLFQQYGLNGMYVTIMLWVVFFIGLDFINVQYRDRYNKLLDLSHTKAGAIIIKKEAYVLKIVRYPSEVVAKNHHLCIRNSPIA